MKHPIPTNEPEPLSGNATEIRSDITEYPEVNQTMHVLSERLLEICGSQIVGIYLSGSLASGDFRVHKSDVDFVVATKDSLDEETLRKIKLLHEEMRSDNLPYADNIEGDYVPLEALKKYNPENSTYPHLGNDGHFEVEKHDSDEIIQRSVLREKGLVLYGPSPKTLIDPISVDDVKQSARMVLLEWWKPLLLSEKLETSEYQAYAILTMCRSLYTLKFGTVVSKQVAADWATTEFGDQFAECIQAALSWEKGKEINCYEESKAMIVFALEYQN